MGELIENWLRIYQDWANANPLGTKVTMIGGAAIALFWLLSGLVRLILPGKKTRSQVESTEHDISDPAADVPETVDAGTSDPARRNRDVLADPAPEPAPAPAPDTPESPVVQEEVPTAQPVEPPVAETSENAPNEDAERAPVETPKQAQPEDAPQEKADGPRKSVDQVEAEYRESMKVGYVKDVEVIEEKYKRSLQYGEAPPLPPPLEMEDQGGEQTEPVPAPVVADEVDEPDQDQQLSPGKVYGEWPYPTAPQSDPRSEFPEAAPKASQTMPHEEAASEPVEEEEAPSNAVPGGIAVAAPDPAPEEDIEELEAPSAPEFDDSILEPEPVYAEPSVDYSDLAGAAPIEEGLVDTGSESAAPESETASIEEELFDEDIEHPEIGAEEQEDAAFEDALDNMKRSREDETANGENNGHDVTEMNNPLAFLKKKEQPPEPDMVDVSVFSPKRVQPAQAFILQAIFHVEEQKIEVASVAAAIDPDAEHRISKTLRQAVHDGQIISASLDIPEATIDQPVQAFAWRGDIEPLQFIVTIPEQAEIMSTLAKLQIALDGVPVASAVWRIVLSPEADVVNEAGEYIPIQRYRRAFVSYSSKDRVEVLKRVQGLQAAGLEVFQDVLDLEPGERWSKALYRNIDDADAFYLFWSENSADSEWVAKEWRYALERSMTHPDKRPDICPVILTAPPPMPPADLADRHFNDILAYVLKAHEAGGA